jgi:hypothetical protein
MMVIEKEYNNFVFLIGESSIDIFDYYGIDEMHGLNRFDCAKKIDTNKSAYICGWCNFHPKDKALTRPSDKKPFLFMNSIRFQGDFRDVSSLMHEATHLSMMLHNWNVDDYEEEIISLAESLTNDLYVEHYTIENFQDKFSCKSYF